MAEVWQEIRSEAAPGRSRGRQWTLAGLFLQIVDSGIPSSMENPESLRRARIILSFTLVLMMVGMESMAFFSWMLPPQLVVPIGLSLIVGLLLCLAIPRVLRRPGSLELSANLVIGSCFLVMLTSFLVVGGIRAPLLHWLALLPMLALLMGARASAWSWAAVSFGTMVTLMALDAAGVALPDSIALSKLEGGTLWLQRTADVGSWIALLFTVSLIYEGHRKQQTVQLAEQNAQLECEIERRAVAEERTLRLAYYDELTGLPNRRLFEQHLKAAMEQAVRIQRMVAVLFLDLDGFKGVNDSHGHASGDRLLQQVGLRLRQRIRMSDVAARDADRQNLGSAGDLTDDPRVVSRLGGDEFTVLLTGIRDYREAGMVAQRILADLEAPFPLDDHQVFISTSIGIALYPGIGDGLNDLLRNADLAMYNAKERGKNTFQFFEESMNREIVRHSRLAADLREGLERGEFELAFQPIVDGESHRVVGVEALARWNHPEQGLIAPGEFIEVAEKCGLIVPLGDWVFREACRQYAKWQAAGLAPARIAINVSGLQFRRGGFVATVLEALRETGVDASCIDLEVTESAMLADEDEASRCLTELKQLGVRVSLDDFGTGYSSLSHVKRFPVDLLKIDRSFVHDIETDPGAQAIATAIIAMAHQLGLEVVGEGVETEGQERFLRDHGCDALQGYRYGRPVSAGETARLLLDRRRSNRSHSR